MGFPVYSLPFQVVTGLVKDSLTGHRRSFRRDSLACIRRLKPPLRIGGEQNIPQQGPCVLTLNHYHRQGFPAQWLALAISAIVPEEIHWIITAELTYSDKWYAFLGKSLSRMILKLVARVYGFTTMPPMPPRPGDVEARAVSVRKVLEYIRHNQNIFLGLAPEGGDHPRGILGMPPAGLGRFALLLASRGICFVPVSVYESLGQLCVSFGEKYMLSVGCELSFDDRDKQTARMIMEHIANLLPVPLRGEFASPANNSES